MTTLDSTYEKPFLTLNSLRSVRNICAHYVSVSNRAAARPTGPAPSTIVCRASVDDMALLPRGVPIRHSRSARPVGQCPRRTLRGLGLRDCGRAFAGRLPEAARSCCVRELLALRPRTTPTNSSSSAFSSSIRQASATGEGSASAWGAAAPPFLPARWDPLHF